MNYSDCDRASQRASIRLAAARSIVQNAGTTAETVRLRVREAQINRGRRLETTSGDAARIRKRSRENREPHARTNSPSCMPEVHRL
jgi:hypothetical protein